MHNIMSANHKILMNVLSARTLGAKYSIMRMSAFGKKMADYMYGFQRRECWISATEGVLDLCNGAVSENPPPKYAGTEIHDGTYVAPIRFRDLESACSLVRFSYDVGP